MDKEQELLSELDGELQRIYAMPEWAAAQAAVAAAHRALTAAERSGNAASTERKGYEDAIAARDALTAAPRAKHAGEVAKLPKVTRGE